jgi:hypothetical protein
MKRIFICLSVLGSVLGSAIAGNFSIDPLRVEVEGKPREIIKGFYTIANVIDKDINVAVLPKEYYTLDENKRFGLKWFKFKKNTFRINMNESIKIPYTINVPKNAQGFLMLLNSFGSQKLDENGTVQQEMLHSVFSVPVYVMITGRQTVKAEIEKLEIAGSTAGGIGVMATVKNTGNVYVRPSGSIEIQQSQVSMGSIDIKENLPVFP